MNKSELISIRHTVPEDKNFIMATWLRGLYHSNGFFTEIPKNTFMNHYNRVIENILSNPDTIVKVSCLKDDPTVILGYAVLTSDVILNWIFVKKEWRKIGIARDLVPTTVDTATHFTKAGLGIMKQKGWTFNPFLLNE